VEFATELLDAYLPDAAEHLRPTAERSPWHVLRLLVETVGCAWCVPRVGGWKKAPAQS
jgi:hypothetical protein